MSNPFWFNVIYHWKKMGKGQYGVTFPFLIGAVAIDKAKSPDKELVCKVFNEMKSNPVNGYYCEVRWCGNIDEPVVSVNCVKNAPNVSLEACFLVEDTITIGFTTDLMNGFHLNCETFDETFEKLISQTYKKTQSKKFSKNDGKFTDFTNSDIEFIESVKNL
ncbi:MAG: hypothetical protein OEL55_05390 [Desulfobulbaceae bacterium]|nr:hypothetical protein [Desulfobulbaceae bacterium]